MMKRLTWFLGGAVAGIAGAGMVKKKVKAAAAELTPSNVAKKARDRVRESFDEGRRAMKAKEAELRARFDGRLETLADDLDEGDAVIVGGQQVEPGQVIVLRQVREDRAESSRRKHQA